MKGSILSLNAGSSSIKFALFDTEDNLKATVRGEIENLDYEQHLVARDESGKVMVEKHLPTGFDLALHTLLDFADAHLGRDGLAAVGHRVVHGGADHIAPEVVTPVLLTALNALTPLDPLHMPDNLAPMRVVAAARPGLTQVACYDGGCLLTVTFYGSERVVANYNLMGPVKAALESAVRYTAAELGAKEIRANAISPGPISTRAASGIAHFDELLVAEAATAPEHQLVGIEDIGAMAAYLVSDGARHITGTIIPVDSGQHLMA